MCSSAAILGKRHRVGAALHAEILRRHRGRRLCLALARRPLLVIDPVQPQARGYLVEAVQRAMSLKSLAHAGRPDG